MIVAGVASHIRKHLRLPVGLILLTKTQNQFNENLSPPCLNDLLQPKLVDEFDFIKTTLLKNRYPKDVITNSSLNQNLEQRCVWYI